MAFQYSNNKVESKTIDSSHYVTNKYVEFRLDEVDVNYLSDIRLINLGCLALNTPRYNPLGGCANLIRHIELLSGREVLCSSRHISAYLAFQQTRQPNEKNKSVNNFLLKSDYAYSAKDGGIALGGDPQTVTNDATTTPLSHISLKDCLPLLEQLPALSTNTFPNLRIRIEFETSSYKVLTTADALTTLEPSLIVDIVRGQMSLPSQVSWLEIQHDEYALAGANPAEAAQPQKISTNVRLNSFNNKYVERVLLVNQFEDETKYGTDTAIKNSSLALYKQELHVRVNGVSKFPKMLTADCVRAEICDDAWGIRNVVQHFNKCYTTDALTSALQIGRGDYNGWVIGDMVKDLQISHNRSCINDNETDSKPNSAMRVHCYAEVRKVLSMKGGDFQVLYA